MTETWQRHGRLIQPSDLPGGCRLTQGPVPIKLRNGLVRLFFSARDAANRSHIFSLDADPAREMAIVRRDDAPIFGPDRVPGAQSVGFASVVALEDGQLRFYGGALRLSPPTYLISIFLCHSSDEGRSFSAPQEVFSSADNGGLPVVPASVQLSEAGWDMWYAAFEHWVLRGDQPPDARYSLRHAVSEDGLRWHADPRAGLQGLDARVTGVISPRVLRRAEGWEMWCSGRGAIDPADPASRRYRLIRAFSHDGLSFEADPRAQSFAAPPCPGDWDSEMQCYPGLLRGEGGRDMIFYCGNDYGGAGIGWASRVALSS